jgi:hypothetical protein
MSHFDCSDLATADALEDEARREAQQSGHLIRRVHKLVEFNHGSGNDLIFQRSVPGFAVGFRIIPEQRAACQLEDGSPPLLAVLRDSWNVFWVDMTSSNWPPPARGEPEMKRRRSRGEGSVTRRKDGRFQAVLQSGSDGAAPANQ